MGNALILFPNRSDPPSGVLPGATLSGPTWQTPLTNMQKRSSSLLSRSVNAQPANTLFYVTMTAQKDIRAVVLNRHNLTVTAQIRLTAWYAEQSEAAPAFQQTFSAYPSLGYTEDLPWEAVNWWDGRPEDEELQGYAQSAIMILPQIVSAPNWKIEILDAANPAGYIEIARLFMAGGWQPTFNYSYGASLAVETDTNVLASLGGQEYFDRHEPYRVARVNFEKLPQEEALLRGFDLARRAGVDMEVFWIADPDNARLYLQTSFLGRMRALPQWAQGDYLRANIGFEIKETL